MKGKKAIGKGETLIILIVAIITFLLISVAVSDWLRVGRDVAEKETCRSSVVLNSRIGGESAGLIQTGLQCPAVTYKLESKLEGEKAKEEIADKISKLLFDCWYKMGEGEAALFSRTHISKEKFCLACSRFQSEIEIPVSKVYESIDKNRAPNGQSYFQYFDIWYGDYGDNEETYHLKDDYFYLGNFDSSGIMYGEEGNIRYLKNTEKTKFEILPLAKTRLVTYDKIEPNKKYTVLYMQRWDSSILGHSDTDYQTIVITPEDQVSRQSCEILYNEEK